MHTQKNEIIRHAFALFSQYGLKRVSMDTIASDLGVSKKTLYVHFATKEELIKQGVRKVADCFVDTFDRILGQQHSPLIKLSLIFRTILQKMFKYDQSYFYTIRRYSPGVLQEVEALRQKINEGYTRPLLQEAQARGNLLPTLNLNMFIDTNLLIIDEAYLRLLSKYPALSLHEGYYHLVVYPIRGICTSVGAANYLTEIEQEQI